jgi:hypothetical protein
MVPTSQISNWHTNILEASLISTKRQNNFTFQHTKLDRNLRLPLPVETVVSHIREATAALRDAQKRHIELRAQHLEDLVSAIIAFRRPSLLEPGQEEKLEKKRKKELRRIQRKEALSRMHRKIGHTSPAANQRRFE